ncbi:hypothetical protein MC7420_1542 [Coleofasciculus chthonoplastes PCC 7420]|uniref:Uncharacterized protein n=1 Tax=Coleofasciculus chthonoplastes PCC 7420 TaxID=118168 RepID=B4W4T6_9CYAN|nr:hypothetical protein MC7420_1542 [Coleofasciculus chthonoplastes PCC 7420]
MSTARLSGVFTQKKIPSLTLDNILIILAVDINEFFHNFFIYFSIILSSLYLVYNKILLR